jgi:hypothetical protein
MFRRLVPAIALLCFLSTERPAGAAAYRTNLRNCLSFTAAAGVTGFYMLPREIQAVVRTTDVLEDLVIAYYDCDTRQDAWLDPNFFQVKVRGEPRFMLSLKDERGWGTITNHLLASLRIYDTSRDMFVHYLNAWSSWSVSDIRLVVDVQDGGIYDMDGVVNGSVDVGLAVGAGIVDDDEPSCSSLFGGGCSASGGVMQLWAVFALVPLFLTRAVFRRG